jgi:hypothetical protein
MPDPGPGGSPQMIVLIALSAPYDAEKFREANQKEAQKKTAGGKDYWVDARGGYAVHFPGDRLLVIGQPQGMETLLGQSAKPEGPLAGAIKLAAGGTRHIVAAVNLKDEQAASALRELRALLPHETAPILSADSMALGVSFGTGVKLDLRAVYATEHAADEAEKAVKVAAEAGRKALAEPKKKVEEAVKGAPGKPKPRPVDELPEAIGGLLGLGAINWLDEFLADPPVKRDGNELVATVGLPSLSDASMRANAVALGLLLPATQKVREAAGRAQDQNNLRALALAMMKYEQTEGRFPAAAGNGFPAGPTGLSWRVHLLPYLGQAALYQEFKLDEPWDSEHNMKLTGRMPDVYRDPRFPTRFGGETFYKVFVGGGAVFEPRRGSGLTSITDGTSRTILIAEGGEPVVWTKPDDFSYDPDKPLPKMTLPGGLEVIEVAMADGSVRTLNLKTTPEKTIRALITKAGGEPIEPW